MEFSYELKKIIPVGNELGEGALWRPSDQTIWWTDIIGRTLYCLKWGQDTPRKFLVPERLGSFGFVAGDDDVLIAAFENGFAYFWPETGQTDWLCQPEEVQKGGGRRLNDGRVGPDGAFWVGSMLEGKGVVGGNGKTGLYRFTGDSFTTLQHSGLQISNGLAWNPDGSLIYLSDSPKSKIFRASFDKMTGACGAFEVFTQTDDGVPDGAAIDTFGNYWSALWGGHQIACYDSSGAKIAKLGMAVPQPTIPVFGGPNLDHLIVTSAREGLSEQELNSFPQSGHVFIYKTNIKGLEPNYYGKTSS